MPAIPKISSFQEAYAYIEQLQRGRTELRKRERALQARMNVMNNYPVIGKDNLAPNLIKALPPHLVPKNVGELNSVMWDFTFTIVLPIGVDPTFTKTSRFTGSFKVDQEAAFLLCGYERTYNDTGAAGRGAPLVLNLRDAQSTRQFNNDVPFPIQNIGEKGRPTMLDTPLLLTKNSTFMIEASCEWLPAPMPTVGDGTQEITFFGLRVRDEDNAKTLATMFL